MKNPIDKETRHFMAEIVSWVFFPPLVGTVFFIFLTFWYANDLNQGLRWLTLVSPFLIFIPLIFFAITYKLGWVNDIDLSDREDRPIYLVVMLVGLAAASIILYLLKVPLKFVVYAFSGWIVTLVTTIITLFWKISFHLAVTTSVVTAIVILGGVRFLPLYILIPIIAWARITLKKHTLGQVVGGFVVPLLLTWAVYAAFGFELFL